MPEVNDKAARPQRVALVHDFLVSMRGADRVFQEIADLYPEADIFTPIYDEQGTEGRFAHRTVNTSFLQRLRPTSRTFRALLPLYPAAIESFDLAGYDLVISSSSAWAHAVICDEDATHVSYCHNPFRYAWNERHRSLEERDPFTRFAMRALFRRWRTWDWVAAQRVDRYVTNSATTQQRISAYLGRDSRVVYPPVDTHRLTPSGQIGDYYMVLSELLSHKRIDVAVDAFNRLGLPLVVVGGGPDRRRLAGNAGPTISFAGRAPDAKVEQLLVGCRALVMPSVEEFGIAAVEAQAAGRPVIAAKAGGAIETIVDGATGRLWTGSVDELVDAVKEFDALGADPDACVANARRFDTAVFRKEFPRQVEAAVKARKGRVQGHDPEVDPVRRAPRRRGGLARPLP